MIVAERVIHWEKILKKDERKRERVERKKVL